MPERKERQKLSRSSLKAKVESTQAESLARERKTENISSGKELRSNAKWNGLS